ncbi:MAG: hypothetical protein ACYSWP_17530 [Planctomycetota bacterium]
MRNRQIYTLVLSVICLSIGAIPTRAMFLAEGAKLVQLTDDGRSTAMAWARQGDLVAFVRQETENQNQLMIMKSDGTGVEAITEVGNPFFVEWSWNGKKLAYMYSNADEDQSQGGIYIYDTSTKRSISVSAPYLLESMDADDGPFWSPDDKYVTYKIEYGPSKTQQVWIADAQSGKSWWILADRGESKEQRWNFSVPARLCLLTSSSGGDYDAATVNPDGRKLVNLTDIGAQNLDIDEPRWSPTGEWIAYTSDLEMTQSERQEQREDCWIVRPDGSDSRNLTKATSAATEEQLDMDEPFWSWDGRWILIQGKRLDNQGNEISTFYMIDPINGGYEIIATSYPRETATYDDLESAKWSYDSKKIAFLIQRSDVRNWGPESIRERDRWVVSIYDVKTKKSEDIFLADEAIDIKRTFGKSDRENVADISWSPDNRSILITIGEIISDHDKIFKPDVYRLDLPERLIDPSAAQHIGPPIGRKASLTATEIIPTTEDPTIERIVVTRPDPSGIVTETIEPRNMTIAEAVASLPGSYDQYLTMNPSRNLILFKGPVEVLRSLRADLKKIDTPAPHILVDMLAVELSDEANRSLGLDWSYANKRFAFYQPSGQPIQKFPHVGTGEDHRVGFPSGALDSLATIAGTGNAFYQGVGQLPREFFIRLNTLVQDGEGRILANPRTVAMSAKESLIRIRKTLNYFFNEGFDVAGRPVVKKSDISADTEGTIVPTLLSNGMIHMLVDVKVGNFTFTKDAGLPELTTRQSTTEVTVEQGQTLILGGLRQQEVSTSVTKIPILGDIPLIGLLFRHEEKDVRNTVLTIFITPQVLKGNVVPPWPEIDPNDHQIVPIMTEPEKTNGDPNHSGLSGLLNGMFNGNGK